MTTLIEPIGKGYNIDLLTHDLPKYDRTKNFKHKTKFLFYLCFLPLEPKSTPLVTLVPNQQRPCLKYSTPIDAMVLNYLHRKSIGSSVRFQTIHSQLLKYPRYALPLSRRNTSIQDLATNSKDIKLCNHYAYQCLPGIISQLHSYALLPHYIQQDQVQGPGPSSYVHFLFF